eukprot:TRINITY_DN2270_c0_g1_i1.p1 TRINITY_DN2270_c0_g1~~TRINITY_DN2270_c0_g1_i1.p1  ORF type:complete len:414 (-),score=44.14 TRINITY_DN2270_c0_g1_i1:148-1389(-)
MMKSNCLTEHSNSTLGGCDYVIRLRGCPFEVSESIINDFLAPACIREMLITQDPQGRCIGDCFVELKDEKSVIIAKSKHKSCIGKRYIDIFSSCLRDMWTAMDMLNLKQASSDCLIKRVKGFSNLDTLIQFLKLLESVENYYVDKTGSEAMVLFLDKVSSYEALKFDNTQINKSIISVTETSHAEMRKLLNVYGPSNIGAIFNPSKHIGQQPYLSHNQEDNLCLDPMKILQFQASQMGFDEASFDQLKSRCQQLLFQKQQMVEMGMDLQKIEEFQQQQQYAQTEEQANQLKSMGVPLCTIQQYQQQQQTLICQISFILNAKSQQILPVKSQQHGLSRRLKLRGIPYRIQTEELEDFFSGYAFEEDSVEIGMDESGRPSGMAWITMKTPSEAVRAKQNLHRQYMRSRYVEIFVD